jgi:hypothetical protein
MNPVIVMVSQAYGGDGNPKMIVAPTECTPEKLGAFVAELCADIKAIGNVGYEWTTVSVRAVEIKDGTINDVCQVEV